MNKHPLDIVNERFANGYYNKLPPYSSYSKDITTISYLMGICSKVDYEIALAKYELSADRWNDKLYNEMKRNKFRYIR